MIEYAFPTATMSADGERIVYEHQGMTLRDWFAGQALAGIGTWVPPGNYVDDEGAILPEHSSRYHRLVHEARSRYAYAQADAMMKARRERT